MRIENSGLRFEDLQIFTDAQINEVFPPTSSHKVEGEYCMPDFEQLKKELAKPGVTLSDNQGYGIPYGNKSTIIASQLPLFYLII